MNASTSDAILVRQAAARRQAAQAISFGTLMLWLSLVVAASMFLILAASWPQCWKVSAMITNLSFVALVFAVVSVPTSALGHILNVQLDLAGAPGLPERGASQGSASVVSPTIG